MKEGINKITNSKSKTFLAFCFCFIFGAGLFSGLDFGRGLMLWLYVSSFGVLFFAIIFWHLKTRRFVCLCLLFVLFGGLRFLITIPRESLNEISHYNGGKETIVGFVSDEPELKENAVNYTLQTEKICESENCSDFISVQGNLLVKLSLYPRFQYGDKLKIDCSLQEPEPAQDSSFRYDKYLARNGIWSICNGAQVKATLGREGNFGKRIILGFKAKTEKLLERLLPEPESSFMAGLLYGARSGLPKELTDNFSRVGITHIIAVSGYNISVIAVAVLAMLLALGLNRRQAFWIAIILIVLFVIFTGATASVVRAGIMGIIVLIAKQLGRLSRIGNVLALTAGLMLLLNPYVLVWDAGFQLSFLATLGLVYLSPILQDLTPARIATQSVAGGLPSPYKGEGKNKTLENINNSFKETFISTLSAIIATLPLILFQFGRLSIVAPLVNVLVLWIIPYLMLLGFLSLFLSIFIYPFGQVVAWVAGLGLKYVIIVASWFGSKSWSAIDFSLPWWGMVMMYVVIVIIIRRNKRATNLIPSSL